MFWWLQTELEATKIEGEETWHCPVCGQKFRCQNTFATHWDASHAKTLGMAEETVCLDDFCDVFRCDILRKKMLKQRLEEEEELSRAESKKQSSGIQSVTLFKHRVEDNEDDDEETREKKKNCDPQHMVRIHDKCRVGDNLNLWKNGVITLIMVKSGQW
ncbi:c2H2-type domain-containing protein [Nephila pilipes]|uniref:C2H2-type domain-containing protein n=1 Tax=Nephila pilipes TaxID=299642 RepID=A0A8X6JAV7_NEPPI|nr:c2H2-type domain-containing protein [Nephila pilipes]